MSVQQYVVRGTDGREYGPVDLATLQEWVKQGRVSHDSKIRNLGNGMMLMASNMPELDGFFGGLHAHQRAVMTSGMVYGSSQPQEAEYWEDYKFVLAMSVIGMVVSLAIGPLALIFSIMAIIRAWQAAREGKPMSGLAFGIAIACMLATVAVPFLLGFWLWRLIRGN